MKKVKLARSRQMKAERRILFASALSLVAHRMGRGRYVATVDFNAPFIDH